MFPQNILLLLTAFSCPGQSLDFRLDPRLVRLIPDFGRHLYIHEAVLFPLLDSGSQEELQTLVRLQKSLSAQSFPSSIVRNLREFRNQVQRWPLCVVPFFRAAASVKKEFLVSGCTWLLVDPPLLSNLSLPVDSEIFVARFTEEEALIVISEVYRVFQKGDAYKETAVVVWSPDTGISKTTTQSLPLRRSDLSGVVLKFLVVLEPPWAYTIRDDNDVTTFHGYIPDVADELRSCTNISFRMEAHCDHQYGFTLPSGNWTGMIGEIVMGPELIVAGPFSMTPERFGVIDFTYTLYNNRDIMVVRRPSNDHDSDSWQRLMSPFRLPVWMAVLTWFLVSGLFLFLISDSRSMSDALLLAAGTICGQATKGCEGCPRLLVLSLHFTALCLVASYTGQLTAYLGIRRVNVPFYGMEGLLTSDIHQLGMLQGSSSHDYFDKSADLLLIEIHDKMMAGYEMPTTDEEGLRHACQDKNYAYVIDEQSLRVDVKNSRCHFLEIPDAFVINKICLGASRGFPYMRIFNYWLMRLRKHGILSHLESKHFPSTEEIDSEEMVGVSVEVAAPLLVALGVGMLAALLVFALEVQYHRLKQASVLRFARATVGPSVRRHLWQREELHNQDLETGGSIRQVSQCL